MIRVLGFGTLFATTFISERYRLLTGSRCFEGDFGSSGDLLNLGTPTRKYPAIKNTPLGLGGERGRRFELSVS